MSSEKFYTDKEWEKKIKELEYWDSLSQAKLKQEHRAANATSKNKFKPFIDSMGEIVKGKLVLKQEALDAFRVGKAGERFESRCKKLTNESRLYAIEVEESLLAALKGLIQLYDALPKQLISTEETDFLAYIKDRAIKMRGNLYHKKDRIARPEVYTDINRRYDTQKRER